jgi:hypothetical protein
VIQKLPPHIPKVLSCLLLLASGCSDDSTQAPSSDREGFEEARQDALETAADPRFDEFRSQCVEYHATMARVQGLEKLMSRREASEAQIAEWKELSEQFQMEHRGLLAYMTQDRFSNSDHQAMRWLMSPGN